MSIEGKVTKLTVKHNSYEVSSQGQVMFTAADIAAALGSGGARKLSEHCFLTGFVFYTKSMIRMARKKDGSMASGFEMQRQVEDVCNQDTSYRDFRAWVQAYFLALCYKHSWLKADDENAADFCKAVAGLAILEFTQNGICTVCNGTGWNSARSTQCRQCGSAGQYRSPSLDFKASFTGKKKSGWHKTWEPRYQDLLLDIQSWKSQFDRQLVRKTQT